MAEFKDVMREWKRMCAYETDRAVKQERYCGMVCPIGPLSVCGDCGDWRDEDFARAEKLIIDWADEHPASQFPTWADWLSEMGVITCAPMVGKKMWYAVYAKTVNDPIPAYIAGKLVIEPKEVEK